MTESGPGEKEAEIVRCLLRAKADPDSLTHFESPEGKMLEVTPLIKACIYGWRDLAKALIEFKADPEAQYGEKGGPCLLHACAFGHEGIASDLIAAGAAQCANAQVNMIYY